MRVFVILSILISAVSVGCHVGTQPTAVTNRLTGYVVPVDVDNYPFTGQYANTSVVIEGTGYHTTTDASGYWSFDNVPASESYKLLITRQGYDTTELPVGKFSGAGVDFLDTAYVVHLPTDSLVLDSLVAGISNYKGWPAPSLTCFGRTTSMKTVLIVFGASVRTPIDTVYGRFGTVPQSGNFSGFIGTAYDADSLAPPTNGMAMMRSGETVYVKAYLAPVPGCYQRPGVRYFLAPKYSNTISIKIP